MLLSFCKQKYLKINYKIYKYSIFIIGIMYFFYIKYDTRYIKFFTISINNSILSISKKKKLPVPRIILYNKT